MIRLQTKMISKIITTSILLLVILIPENFSITDKVICVYNKFGLQRTGNGKFEPADIQVEYCTHIIYAYIGLNVDGSLIINDDQEALRSLGSLKNRKPNLKLLVSVGGSEADLTKYAQVSGSEERIEKMLEDTIKLCQTYNFDGLDVAWMYPRGGERSKYRYLLTELKNGLHLHNYLLSASLYSIPDEAGGYVIPEISDILDLMNILSFDFSDMWGPTAVNAPLFSGNNMTDFQKENRNVNVSIQNWLSGGANPEKITLALPFFGHSFYLSNINENGVGAETFGAADPAPYTGLIGSVGYNEICEFYNNGTTVFLNDMKVPYLYNGKLWIGFDDAKSASYKIQYAKENNLGGIVVWSVDTDDFHGFCGKNKTLLQFIYESL